MPERPTCSVVAPFAGTDAELAAFVRVLAGLVVRPGDELLVADNRPAAVARAAGPVTVLAAAGPPSAYFARAVAARRARGEWLVFVDADCVPAPDLLDAYFLPSPADPTVAVLAGAIEDWTERDTPAARHIAARRKLSQTTTLAHPYAPYAQTACCAVRRDAFEAVGGWPEPIRSGGDADLCWRLRAAGYALESRPGARVRHRNRTSWPALWRQLARHGAGMAWLDRRWPGSNPPPRPRELAHRFSLPPADQAAGWARDLGRLRSNQVAA